MFTENYGWSSVMTDQISNLTQQSFPEIHRNRSLRDYLQSLNETIWTLKFHKLHVFNMVDEMERKKFFNYIISACSKIFRSKS